MANGKVLLDSFIMEMQSENLFRRILPDNYLLRKYPMDFGIDFDLELFEREGKYFVTQGEHILIQLKTSKRLKHKKIKPIDFRHEDEYIDVIVFRIELSFIKLVERMGDALPVLLVLVDLENNEIYYLCINDYIHYTMQKINENIDNKKSINLYIPVSNKLNFEQSGIFPIQFYGKRSKLISFCNRIQIIAKDFEYCSNIKEIQNLIVKTVNWCLSLDIWTIESKIPALHYFFEEIKSVKQNNYISPFAKELMKNFSLDDEPFCVRGFTDLSYDETIIYNTGKHLANELINLTGMLDSYVFSWYLP